MQAEERKVQAVRPEREVMTRQRLPYFIGISGETVGARGLAMHIVVIPPGARAEPHLHVGYETGIYVIEGRVLTRWGEKLDIGKMVVLTELLQAEGDILAAQHLTGDAQSSYLKALELLLEVAFDSEPNLAAVQPRVAALRQRLDAATMPPDLAECVADSNHVIADLHRRRVAQRCRCQLRTAGTINFKECYIESIAVACPAQY